MKKKIVLVFMIAVVLIGFFIYSNTIKKNQLITYEYPETSTKMVSLRIEIPKSYDYQIEPFIASTSEWDGTPDWGITIFVNKNKEDRLYLYASHSSHTFSDQLDYRTETETIIINNKSLIWGEEQGRILGYLTPYEDYGIVLNMDRNVFYKNKETIIRIISSAQLVK